MRQTVEAHFLQSVVLVNGQSGGSEQFGAANNRQVGKQLAEAAESSHPVQDQVVGYLPQAGKAEIGEVAFRRLLQQHDLQRALDDGAVDQLIELGQMIAHVDAAAHLFAVSVRSPRCRAN